MISTVKKDWTSFRQHLRKQDMGFYLGLFFIVLYYLRPQYIFSELLIIPWLQITIVGGLLVLFSQGKLSFKKEHFLILFLGLLVLGSAFASRYPQISFNNISTPFIFFAEVLFLSNCARTLNQLKLLLLVLFLCVFKMSFFGARVWASRGFGFADWGIQGPPGFFQNSGEYTLLMAIIAVMSIPVIAAFKPQTKIYWILPITAIMAAIGASSRGGQLALLVGLIYLLLAFKKLKPKNLVYILLVVSIVWAIFPERQLERFQTAGDDKTSTARLDYWSAGLDMMVKNPMLGIGYDAFPEHYDRYYKVHDGSFLMRRKEVAHNSMVEVGATIGIPALIVYLWMHWCVFKRGKRPKKPKADIGELDNFLLKFEIALKASVVTYFVGSIFMSVAFYPYLYHLLAFSIIAKRLIRENSK